MKKLRVVDLEQHSGDLSGEVRVLALKEAISEQFNETSFILRSCYLDEREEAFAKHLLLFLHRSCSKHRSGQRLLDIIGLVNVKGSLQTLNVRVPTFSSLYILDVLMYRTCPGTTTLPC